MANDYLFTSASVSEGHPDNRLRPFGRTEPEFTWERTDRAEALAAEGKVVKTA